jgi:hypothetical protein
MRRVHEELPILRQSGAQTEPVRLRWLLASEPGLGSQGHPSASELALKMMI